MSSMTKAVPQRQGWPDTALALLLFAATVIYLSAFPLLFHSPDEPHMLHQAKRVLAGEVMYRDIFELTTPGWAYLMAALFWLFGTTLRTARLAVAVIHGFSVVLVFIACRRLGVRCPLAWATGAAYLVVAQPAYPVASYHWLATMLSVLLLVLCIELRGRSGWIFAAGVVVGLIAAVHQQRGLSLGAGVALIVAADSWFGRRSAASPTGATFIRNLAALVAGTLVVVVPLGLMIVARAGVDPVWQALVVFPLSNYAGANRLPWGGWLFSAPPETIFARLLTYSPAVFILTLGASLLRSVRTKDVEPVRLSVVLTLFALVSIASIAYNPDLIHVALIVPVFLVALAAGVEWVLGVLPGRLDTLVGWAGAVAVVVACSWQLERNLPGPLPRSSVTYDSSFGPLPMDPQSVRFFRELDQLLQRVPGRTLYRYPFSWYTYLIADARNPTRFEFILAGYHSREQMEEVITTLRTADIPYVMVDAANLAPDDPIYRFIQERYEPLTNAAALDEVVWGRKRDSLAGG